MVDLPTLLRPTPTRPRYGALLIPVTSTGASERLTAAAVCVANQQGSQLVGLACAPRGGSDRLATAAEQDAMQLLTDAAVERFDRLTRSLRAGRSWRRCEGALFDVLRAQAWAGDLIMLGAQELREKSSISALRRLLVRTGCPVLVWPDRREASTIEHVAVLCDDSPAAAHALRAAAPLLMRSTKVSLVGAGRLTPDVRRGLQARGLDEVHVEKLERALSSVAAERLVDTSADLIVLGAWSEFLGGWPKRSVTDILLDGPQTPLLLAA